MGCLPQPDLKITVDGCKYLAVWRKQRHYSGTDLELGTARDQELPNFIQQELGELDLLCLSPVRLTVGSSFSL